MEIKRTLSKFIYRIEPKPEGGFIARAVDPGQPTLEAPTREELQQKILATIRAGLAQEFPALQLPLENLDSKNLKYSFHIEAKPGGGFIADSTDPNQPPIEGDTHEDIQHRLAEKLAGALGSYVLPELEQAMAGKIVSGDAKVFSGDVKVFVNRKTVFSTNVGTHKLTLGDAQQSPSEGTSQPQSGTDVIELNNNAPIVPVAGGNWKLFRFLIALLVLAAFAYFFLHRG